jgi:hypothetical protein
MPTMATVFTHWKSSVQGILALVVATCHVLTQSGDLNAQATKWVTLIGALAFTYIALISKDSGVQEAIPPGGGPAVAMPSHETPDQPGSEPVLKGK